MSATNSQAITIAAPPTLVDVATDMIAWMAAQSGVQTDFNIGGQYRTNAEATGSVMDMQGIISQALAFQALVYSAYAAFNITPAGAEAALGSVIFSTGPNDTGPAAVMDVLIGAGTIVSTVGGVQFTTIDNAILLTGATSAIVSGAAVATNQIPVRASILGVAGNVAALSIVQLVTGLPYPLFVNNMAKTDYGADAETQAQTLARFTAVVGSLGRSTPVALANAAIGVSVSGETVRYSTVYEPWIAMGVSGVAGFELYIDNGTGGASTGLIEAVRQVVDGNFAAGEDGYRPAGVPYGIFAVTPIFATVVVSGTAIMTSADVALETAVGTAVTAYFAGLQFGDPAELTQIIAAVANSTAYSLSSLQVWLLDAGSVSRQEIDPSPTQRMRLTNVNAVIA